MIIRDVYGDVDEIALRKAIRLANVCFCDVGCDVHSELDLLTVVEESSCIIGEEGYGVVAVCFYLW